MGTCVVRCQSNFRFQCPSLANDINEWNGSQLGERNAKLSVEHRKPVCLNSTRRSRESSAYGSGKQLASPRRRSRELPVGSPVPQNIHHHADVMLLALFQSWQGWELSGNRWYFCSHLGIWRWHLDKCMISKLWEKYSLMESVKVTSNKSQHTPQHRGHSIVKK